MKTWGAVVVMSGMCVPFGKSGTAIVQCRSRESPTSIDGDANTPNSREFLDQLGLWESIRLDA